MRLRLTALLVLLAGCRPMVTVSGHVEVAGAGAEGVLVQLVSGAGGETVSAITGEDGRFSLEAGPGARTLVASADSVLPRQVTVSLSEAPTPLVVRFTAVGTLTGKVLLGGRPQGNAGLPVRVPGLEDATTVTDDEGGFRLELPVGSHRVEGVAPGHLAVVSPVVEVRRGETTTLEPLVLKLVGFGQTGALVGQVTRLNGSSDGVEVLLEGAGFATETSDGGQFAFSEVPEGSYTLQLRYDGLVERVPRVLVTRGADGFVVDRGVYRLGDHPIPLMEATRLDGDPAELGVGRGSVVTWRAGGAVRWTDVRQPRVHEAGRLVARRNTELPVPQVSHDGNLVVWASSEGLFATPLDAGVTQRLAAGFLATGAARGFSMSPSGQVAFVGYPPGLNEAALQVASLHDGGVQVIPSSGVVYTTAVVDEALVWIADVRDDRGALRWWREGGGPVRTIGNVEALSALGRGRFLVTNDPARTTWTVFDLATGRPAFTHPGPGRLSSDERWYGAMDTMGVTVRELATEKTTRLGFVAPWGLACVWEDGAVVGTSDGGVLALTPGKTVELGRGLAVSCTQGHVYLTVGSQRESTLHKVSLTGGALVPLASGARGVLPWTLRIDEANDRVWFITDTWSPGQGSFGTLWTASASGGAAVKVSEDVAIDSWVMLPSPGGRHAAFRTLTGLAIIGADGTGLRRLSTGVSEVAWVDDETVVFTMAEPRAPLKFQGGLYLARVRGHR